MKAVAIIFRMEHFSCRDQAMVVEASGEVCLSDHILPRNISCQVPPVLFEGFMGHLGLCEKCVDRAMEIEVRGRVLPAPLRDGMEDQG